MSVSNNTQSASGSSSGTHQTSSAVGGLRISNDILLRRVLPCADIRSGLSLVETCRSFRHSITSFFQQQWAQFPIGRYPHLRNLFGCSGPIRNVQQLQMFWKRISRTTPNFGNRPPASPALLAPADTIPPCEEALRRENDRNLVLIVKNIMGVLHLNGVLDLPFGSSFGGLTADAARAFLHDHSEAIANITILSLENLGLTMIPEEFAKLNFPKLDSLSLRGNRIATFPTNFLENSPRLSHLNLRNSGVATIPANFLANNPNLDSLNLSHNQIATLPTNFLVNNPNLESLDLSHNQIAILPANFLANSPDLSRLNLSYNQIATLPANFLMNNSGLFRLDLRNNQITILPTNFLANTRLLRDLDLRGNRLNHLPLRLRMRLVRLLTEIHADLPFQEKIARDRNIAKIAAAGIVISAGGGIAYISYRVLSKLWTYLPALPTLINLDGYLDPSTQSYIYYALVGVKVLQLLYTHFRPPVPAADPRLLLLPHLPPIPAVAPLTAAATTSSTTSTTTAFTSAVAPSVAHPLPPVPMPGLVLPSQPGLLARSIGYFYHLVSPASASSELSLLPVLDPVAAATPSSSTATSVPAESDPMRKVEALLRQGDQQMASSSSSSSSALDYLEQTARDNGAIKSSR